MWWLILLGFAGFWFVMELVHLKYVEHLWDQLHMAHLKIEALEKEVRLPKPVRKRKPAAGLIQDARQ